MRIWQNFVYKLKFMARICLIVVYLELITFMILIESVSSTKYQAQSYFLLIVENFENH